jgi:ribosomal protein S18 acetylase RimI-like enzyme
VIGDEGGRFVRRNGALVGPKDTGNEQYQAGSDVPVQEKGALNEMSGETHIRFLARGDEPLLVSAVSLTDEGPITVDVAEAFLDDTSLVCIVAVQGASVVGFIYGYILKRFEATSLFIYSVDVDENHQRRGIASRMMDALSERGRNGDWDEMFVFTNDSNTAAKALYSRSGGMRPNPDDVMFDFHLRRETGST